MADGKEVAIAGMLDQETPSSLTMYYRSKVEEDSNFILMMFNRGAVSIKAREL